MTEPRNVQCKIRIKRRIENQMLKGYVRIVSSELSIQHAYIEIFGHARCSWKSDKARFKWPKLYLSNSVVKGEQRFYYSRHSLCGGEATHVHRGETTYQFECYWPSRLPGTWVGDHGSIEYTGTVNIILTEEEGTYTYNQKINVKFRRKLHSERHLLFEGSVDMVRSFFSSRALGNISVNVWLPICGVAAGQTLPVFCSVVNRSKLHFGSIIFVLTRTDIYKLSDTPFVAVKKVRTDICRVARVVDIHKGRYEYYSTLRTLKDETIPTNQFYTCNCIQVIYEVWVSVQGVFRRYMAYGYPNIDTPGIPVIIGTHPLKEFDTNEITREIFKKMYEYHVPLLIDELPEEFKDIIHTTEEELTKQAIDNLQRQLSVNEKMLNDFKKAEKHESFEYTTKYNYV